MKTIRELLDELEIRSGDHDADVRAALGELLDARLSLAEFRKGHDVCPKGHPFDPERYCYGCGTMVRTA